jgi:hypothetical protein
VAACPLEGLVRWRKENFVYQRYMMMARQFYQCFEGLLDPCNIACFLPSSEGGGSAYCLYAFDTLCANSETQAAHLIQWEWNVLRDGGYPCVFFPAYFRYMDGYGEI